jgi:hypothetical protein
VVALRSPALPAVLTQGCGGQASRKDGVPVLPRTIVFLHSFCKTGLKILSGMCYIILRQDLNNVFLDERQQDALQNFGKNRIGSQ